MVIDHRTYRMHISLNTYPGIPAILANPQFFALRLSRAASRPTNVTVEGPDAADALPHIAAHLSHIKRLSLTTSLALVADVLTTLRNAAPILESVEIYLLMATACMPVALPFDIFNFNAPLLKDAFFFSVFLESPLPPVFRHLSRLGFGGLVVGNPDGEVRFQVPDVFAACPNMRELLLCEDVALSPVFWEPQAWTKIERLSLSGGTIGRTWHRLHLPIHCVPMISISGGELSMLPILAGHLPGTLTLFGDAFTDDGCFTISLKCTGSTSARERQLCADLPVDAPREIANDAMWARVVRIVLSVDHWDSYVPLFGAPPALEEVVLVQVLQWLPLLLTAELSLALS